MYRLPTTATAPFCPSEVQGTVSVPVRAPLWKKLLVFFGPGLLVSVGYMDPGNWATDIEAGAKYGYALLFVVLLSSLAAIFLQVLTARVGIATQKDLAQLARERYSRSTTVILWLLAEVAIIMTDVAEVLGAGLAFNLLFGVSLETGILLTILDTIIVLGLQGHGFRRIEAIVLGLILTIGACFLFELVMVQPHWPSVAAGFVPDLAKLPGWEPWFIAVGICGATVMPHNLFLHSSIVNTRKSSSGGFLDKAESIKMNTIDTVFSLSLAFFVNAAILILAAAAFHATGHHEVTGIDQAYHMLDPLVGGTLASIVFALALLAAGQSSTFTGTIAGQIVMDGFMNWKIPCWQRRLITRALALLPAYFGVVWLGEHSIGKLLVISQVVLSLQLPFTIFPLIIFASDRGLMGDFRIPPWMRAVAWLLFAAIVGANGVMLVSALAA